MLYNFRAPEYVHGLVWKIESRVDSKILYNHFTAEAFKPRSLIYRGRIVPAWKLDEHCRIDVENLRKIYRRIEQ